MTFTLTDKNTIANRFIAELRDRDIQKDRMRFRFNMERIGQALAFEISKTLSFIPTEVETQLGIAKMNLPNEKIVLATILRAGIAMQEGMLHVFDDAYCAFISAHRQHHKDGTFEIKLESISCSDLTGAVLILTDPMLATGASMHAAAKELCKYGEPKKIHFATAIASVEGKNYLRRLYPHASIWMGALDEELTAKSYIVPGLGDAGDLSYGDKLQD